MNYYKTTTWFFILWIIGASSFPVCLQAEPPVNPELTGEEKAANQNDPEILDREAEAYQKRGKFNQAASLRK